MIHRSLPVACTLVLLAVTARAQSPARCTLSGTVSDSLTGETLIGATVMLSGAGNAGTSTNEYGFYSITVAASITDWKVTQWCM